MYNHSFLFIVDSNGIMDIPTSRATQLIIGAMQSCENYSDTISNNTFRANLISGYPRSLNDIEDYMTKVTKYTSDLYL